jgi:DNA repair exonuclease SbcCD ATPase subunit
LAYDASQEQLRATQAKFQDLEQRLHALKETEENAGALRTLYQQYQAENGQLLLANARLELEVEQLPPLKQAVSELRDAADHAGHVAYQEHLEVERLQDGERRLSETIETLREQARLDGERVRSMSALVEQKNRALHDQEALAKRKEADLNARYAAKQDDYLGLQLRFFNQKADLEQLEAYYKEKFDTLDTALTRQEQKHRDLEATVNAFTEATDQTVTNFKSEINRLNTLNADLERQVSAQRVTGEFQEAYEAELVEFALRTVLSKGGFINEVDVDALRRQVLESRGYLRDQTALKGGR